MIGSPQFVPVRRAMPARLTPMRRRVDRRMGWLAALTPDQAAQVAMPTSAISTKAGFTQAVYNDLVQAAQTGNFVSFNPSGCSQAATGSIAGAALTKVGSNIAIKLAGASSILGPIGAIAAPILGIFSSIFTHHSQAVAKEQQVVCSAVPSAGQALQVIEQAVQNGTIEPATGIASLQQVVSEFQSAVQPIIKMNSSQCNAACVWTKELQAIVAEMSSQWQDQINSASGSPVTTSGATAAGSTSASLSLSSLPSWWPLAAAAGLAFVLLL